MSASDLEILLEPFQLLHRADAIKIKTPKILDPSAIMLIKNTESACPGNRTDREVRQRVNAWSAWIECLLDDMPGVAAGHMRFEQLASYCPKYADEACKRIADGIACAMLPQDLASALYRGLESRRQAAWTFDSFRIGPKIPSLQNERTGAVLPPDYWGFSKPGECLEGDTFGLQPSYNRWEKMKAMRPGIPRRSSVRFRMLIADAKWRGRGLEGFLSMETQQGC